MQDDEQGVQHLALGAMRERADERGLSNWARHGILKWDAMKVSEGFVTDVHTGRIVGYDFDGLGASWSLEFRVREGKEWRI